MSSTLLAPPEQLYDASEDKAAFEESRDSALLAEAAVDAVVGKFGFHELDWNDLFRYVSRHREVLPVLFEAPGKIRATFGDAEPMLELVAGLEEDWEQLFIVIPIDEPGPMAIARLNVLDKTWFAGAAKRAQFAVNVTVERRV